MIRVEALAPAPQPSPVGAEAGAFYADICLRCRSLTSRALLGALLAAVAVLVPGEATRLLDAPLTWSDVLGT